MGEPQEVEAGTAQEVEVVIDAQKFTEPKDITTFRVRVEPGRIVVDFAQRDPEELNRLHLIASVGLTPDLVESLLPSVFGAMVAYQKQQGHKFFSEEALEALEAVTNPEEEAKANE